MNTNEIGGNAGRIWNLLDTNPEVTLHEMREKLGLSDPELYMAIGWLERENKLYQFEADDELVICLKE